MPENQINEKEIILKSLLYRSLHRGCKETDILLGKFAQKNIGDFSDAQIKIYQDFVLEDDALIYDWILQKSPTPSKYNDLVNNIRQFHDL